MAATGESRPTAPAQRPPAQPEAAFGEPMVADVHGRHGQTVAFTPDGARVLCGGQDARIAVLDAAAATVEAELTGHTKVVNAVQATPDGRLVVSVSSDRTVRTWNLDTREAIAVLEGHRDAVVALDLAPDGATAITGGYDGRLRRWDLARATCEHEVRSELKRIAAVAYAPEGHQSIECGQGPLVYVRELDTGAVVAELDTAAAGVVDLAVSPDGALLAAAGYDGDVTVWDCDGWEQVRRLPAGDRASAVAFSRTGRLLAAAARRQLRIWSPDHDEPVTTTTLPIDGIYDLAFSPDARRLAQAGADGKIRIWDLL